MTAPAVSPSAPLDSESPFAIDNEIASITRDAVAQTLAESPDAPDADLPRGPDGKFVAKPKEPTSTGEIPPADHPTDPATAPDPDAQDSLALPKGFVAVPPVKDRPLATTFKVLDHEGELEVPEFTIEFMANGKTRSEPLDKVVRLAERGVYNEEREQQVVQQREEAQTVVRQNQQLLQYAQRLEQHVAHLLSSDDAYLTERAKYDAQNTPEAQLERERSQRQQAEQQVAYAQAAHVSSHYFEHTVAPAVEKITEVLPTITADEIGARLVLLTNHLRVQTPSGDTIIPPAAHQQVNQIILRDIAPWAQQLHDSRDTFAKTERAATEKRLREAEQKTQQSQVEAQKARNLVGRQARRGPAGPTGTRTREAEPPKPIKDIDDAMSSALDATMAAMGMTRSGGS